MGADTLPPLAQASAHMLPRKTAFATRDVLLLPLHVQGATEIKPHTLQGRTQEAMVTEIRQPHLL